MSNVIYLKDKNTRKIMETFPKDPRVAYHLTESAIITIRDAREELKEGSVEHRLLGEALQKMASAARTIYNPTDDGPPAA